MNQVLQQLMQQRTTTKISVVVITLAAYCIMQATTACTVGLSNCLSCSGDSCTSCGTGYGVRVTDNPPSCANCQNNKCLNCSTNNLVCSQCQPGSGFDSGGACTVCQPSNCSLCTFDYTKCTQCNIGFGVQNGTCISCVYDNCTECLNTSASQCTRCTNSNGPNGGVCVPCQSSNCDACQQDDNICTNCQPGYGLNVPNDQCLPCLTGCQQCSGANYQQCTSCISGYYLSNQTCTKCLPQCLTCTVGTSCVIACPPHCTSCNGDNATNSNCLSCQVYYQLSATALQQCQQICGDYIAIDDACDNGIGIAYDGCNDDCTVQTDFQCNKNNNISVCSYQLQVVLQLTNTKTDKLTHQLTLTFSVSPPLHIFRTSDLTPTLTLSQPSLTIKQVSFSQQNQLILIVQYSQTLQNKNITLQFVPDTNIDIRYFATPNTSISIVINVKMYNKFVVVGDIVAGYLVYGVVAVGLVAVLLGLGVKRLAGLQAIVVCQIAVVSFIFLGTLAYAPNQYLQILRYCTGLHISPFQTPPEQTSPSSRLLQTSNSTQQKSPHFDTFQINTKILSNNINILVGIQFIPALCYLITIIVLSCFDCQYQKWKKNKQTQDYNVTWIRENMERCNKAKEVFLQCLMYVGMFNLAYFTFCAAVFFKYSTQITQLTSLIVLSVGLLLYLITFIVFYFDPDPFDYFRYMFRKEVLAMTFYFIYPFAIVSTVILVVIISEPWPSVIPFALLLLFVAIYKPYRQRKQNMRCIFNLVVALSCLSMRIFVYYYYHSLKDVGEPAFIFHFVNIILLLIVVIVSLVFLIHHIIYVCFLKPKQEQNEKTKVMVQLEEVNVREKMKEIQKDQNVFKKLLQPKVNILNFSNSINNVENYQSVNNNQTQPNMSWKVRKAMQEEKIKKNDIKNDKKYDSLRKLAQKKIEQIDKLKKQVSQQQAYKKEQKIMTKQQQDIKMVQNKKLIYAMEVLEEENTYIRLKNAKDFTGDLVKSGVNKKFIEEYERIGPPPADTERERIIQTGGQIQDVQQKGTARKKQLKTDAQN